MNKTTQDLAVMTVDQLDKLAAHILCEDIRRYGWIHEDNHDINVVSDAIVQAMVRDHGEAHLWQPNPYGNRNIHLRVQTEDDTYAYPYGFVTPAYDAELERLIVDRLDAPYTGTADDAPRVEAIFSRMEALGGISLIWS